jgi:diacylglycerol kinase
MDIRRLTDSFRYAINGLYVLFSGQPNARIHLLAAAFATTAGWYFQISANEWIAIVLCIGMVISMEAMNTALEQLTNLVSPEVHPLAGRAKDLAAGAVLFAALTAVVVAGIIFLPKIFT